MSSIESGTPFDKKPGKEAGEEPGMGTFGQPADLTEQARPATEAAKGWHEQPYDQNTNPFGEARNSSNRLRRGMGGEGGVADLLGSESVRTKPWRSPAERSQRGDKRRFKGGE